jgi:hypothetical protein
MNCQDAREYFSELLDSHIGLTERVPLEAHLRECEACRQELEALRLSERPRPAAWQPSFKLDFFSKALDGLHPADMVGRLRQRIFPRDRVIRRARPRPVLFGKKLEALRPDDRLSPRRSVHARGKIPWRSRFGVARATKALAAIRRIDLVAPLHRAVSSLDRVVRRVPRALDIAGKSLDVTWKSLDVTRNLLDVTRNLLDVIGKLLDVIRKAALDVGGKALQVAQKALQVAQKAVGIARKVLEIARLTLLMTWSHAIVAWHHRGAFPHVPAKHVRLTATGILVGLGAVGLFHYRAELDIAVRRWVPSAPSSGEAPAPRMASTEPATRPEIPPVSPPAKPVPAPPALYPSPAPKAPEKPARETRPAVTAPADRIKGSAQPPEPVTPPRAPAPSSTVRDTRASRPAKPEAGKSGQAFEPLSKGKNGGAKPSVVASASPRKEKATEGVGASAPPASRDTRPSLDVVGRLQVKSRSGAERDLAALVAKAGGTTVSRQRGDKITVIEAVVPNPSYGKFAEGLSRIGSWQIEAGRTRLPDPVRVTVRLAE